MEVEELKYVIVPYSKLSAGTTSMYKELWKMGAESLSGDKAAGVWN